MRIQWERNSRVLELCGKGKIKEEDIIPKTQTHNFEPELATVRMHNINSPHVHVTVHIRGKSDVRQYPYGNGATFECANTCRINFGASYKTMNSNGDLDESLSWLDVHNTVAKVKNTMGMK
jgi:hypothetical protein